MKNPIMKKILTVITVILAISGIIFLSIRLDPFLFRFPERFDSKEELKEFVIEHEEELNDAAKDLIDLYKKSDERLLYIDDFSYNKGISDNIRRLIRKYDIAKVTASYKDAENCYVAVLCFEHVPKENLRTGSFYWYVYYSESGDVLFPTRDEGSNLLEKDGETYFYEAPGLYIHRMEHIVGNWYYWEHQWYK